MFIIAIQTPNHQQNQWVFKVKTGEDRKPARYRARLVAQGFSQRYGID